MWFSGGVALGVLAVSGGSLGLVVRRCVAEAMRLLYQRGLVDVRGGNVSARVRLPWGQELVYITPTGSVKPKHAVEPDDVAVVDLGGEVLEGRPSIEYRMHLEVYRRLKEASAVAHAHNPLTVALAGAGVRVEELAPRMLLELRVAAPRGVGRVPPLEPGSVELARAVGECLSRHDVCILEEHGAVAVGFGDPVSAVYQAVDRLELLEMASLTVLVSLLVKGGVGVEKEG